MSLPLRVEAVGVTRCYGSVRAVNAISFDLSLGVTVLLGRNGAGKSTLSRILAGAEEPDSGELLVRDAAGDQLSRRDRLRRTGWLPQAFGAPSSATVQRLVTYAAWLKEVPRGSMPHLVAEALEATDLTRLRRRRIGSLSGGMLRRLGIAQALVHRPEILILDEPTVGLDPEQRATFHRMVLDQSTSRRVLVSTHLLEDAVALASDALVIEAGSLRFVGGIADLEGQGQGADRAERLRTAFVDLVTRPTP